METRTGSSSSGKSRNGHSGRGRDFLDGQDFALSGLSNGLRGLSENGCRRQESEDKELANGQRNGSNQNCSQDNSIDGSGTKMTGSGCGLNVVVEEVPYIVRRMKESEIPLVLQLCKREGRQMGRSYELISWFRFDPQGFFVAVSPQSGEILGSCAGIRLSSSHGNIGMFVVREDLRGKGIGKNIWNHVIMHLNNFNPSPLPSPSNPSAHHSVSVSVDDRQYTNLNQLTAIPSSIARNRPSVQRYNMNSKKRNLGLSALNSLLPMSRDRSGFTHVSGFSVHLYQLDMSKMDTNGLLFMPSIASSSSLSSSGLKVVPFTPRLIYALLSFDAALHSYDRRKILKLLLSEPEVTFRVAFRGGKIAGYGAIKPSLQDDCYMIAPLYASDSVVAKELLIELIKALFLMIIFEENNLKSSIGRGKADDGHGSSVKVVLKIPSNNLDGITMIESFGFERVDNYCSWRCFTENHFPIQSKKIFAFHSTVFCSE